MKFNIHIDQYHLTKLADKLDITDAAILNWLIWFCKASSDKIIRDDDGYTWVSHNYLLDEMPLLNLLTSSALSKRLIKLRTAGFIKKKIHYNEKNGERMSFIKLTLKVNKLETNKEPNSAGN